MREFIGDTIRIDGRMIGYRIANAHDYFKAKNGWSEEEIIVFSEKNHEAFTLVNQIIAVKQSCWLLRRTTYSSESLCDDMFNLKNKLINELSNKYSFNFDDELLEKFCG